jgi:hypothetical protein
MAEDQQILNSPYTIRVSKNGDVSFEPAIQSATSCWYECRNGRIHRCCQTSSGIQCRPLPYPCPVQSQSADANVKEDVRLESIEFAIHVDERGDCTFEPDVPNATKWWTECRDGYLHICWQSGASIVCRKLNIPCELPSAREPQE